MINQMVDPTANTFELAPGIVVPATALSFTFMRSSGPGGQNVNKVESKARLSVRLADLGYYMPNPVASRLERIAARYLNSGCIVIESQSERSQLDNRRVCIERLAELVRRAQRPPKKRKPTRPTRASKERRIKAKKQRGEIKAKRGRVRRDEW